MASTQPVENPVVEHSSGAEKTADSGTTSADAPGGMKAENSAENPAEEGLFGAWRGFTGLFGVSSEGRAISPRSPTIQLGRAASEIAATATSELENAGKAAQKQLGKAAEEIGKGWGNLNSFLDEILAPPGDEASRGPDPGSRSALDGAAERLHERFPDIDPAEEAVGTYECSLVQKYRCVLNAATPEKTFPVAGILYVTPLHLAMYVIDDNGAFGAPFGVVVPFANVARVQRGQKAMLRIVTKDKSSYVFGGFESDSEFKAALDLLEHLVGSTESQSRNDSVKAPAARGVNALGDELDESKAT